MTFQELIQLAINTAVAGTDADNNPILKQSLEAQGIADQALQALGVMVAGSPELRARLEQQFTVNLSAGVGTIPSGMLVEYLREGVVRDSDTGANNGAGNVLSRIQRFNLFLLDQDTALGQYCVVDNSIYARGPGSTDITATIGPLVIDAPFFPTAADMATTVPDEIANELVENLARRLKGLIAPAEPVT